MANAFPISDADRLRIRDAIKVAEARTAGEIFAVVARESDEYRFIPLLWATLAALLVPLPLLFVRLPAASPADTWSNVAEGATYGLPAGWIFVIQLAVFAILAVILSLPAVKPTIIPGSVKRETAHRFAVDQFLAHGLHMTEARTGALIFVSLAERYAEIVADAGIAAKVDQAVWNETMDQLIAEIRAGRLADGLIAAIGRVGTVLAAHFPPRPRDRDEIPNDLILL